MLNPSLNGRFI